MIPRLEDPLEKGMATHSSVLAWRIHEQLLSIMSFGFPYVVASGRISFVYQG